MADGIAHKQPDIFANVRAAVCVDHSGDVIVFISQYERSWPLKNKEGSSVVALKRPGQHASRVRFNKCESFRGQNVLKILAPRGVRFWTPRQHSVRRIDNPGLARGKR